jgi:glucose-1-phosphate thymidylyltransferase
MHSPVTITTSKHLLNIYDKPMIYYSLATLLLAGAEEIFIVSREQDALSYERLLKPLETLGLRYQIVVQEKPLGIVDGISAVGRKLKIPTDLLVVLGDNLFFGQGMGRGLSDVFSTDMASIFLQSVDNPSAYGIATLRGDRVMSLDEKPTHTQSNLAVCGLYYFPKDAVEKAQKLELSERGELEVTDLLRIFLQEGRLTANRLERGTAWLDMGTVEDFYEASAFVAAIQNRQGQLVNSPEEALLTTSLCSKAELQEYLKSRPNNPYYQKLRLLASEKKSPDN